MYIPENVSEEQTYCWKSNAQPEATLLTDEQKSAGHKSVIENAFLKGIVFAVPVSLVLWAAIIWCIKSILF